MGADIKFDFKGKVWFWKGPAPFYFVSMPEDQSQDLKDMSSQLTYGWGMIPVIATIGKTKWYTAMFEKDGRYILPIKLVIRKTEGIEEGGEVKVHIKIGKE